MAKHSLKPLLTSFSPDGAHLAVVYSDGTVKIWCTSNGSLFGEWKSSTDEYVDCSCIALPSLAKKGKDGTACFVLGTKDGEVVAVDAFTCQTKWKSLEYKSVGLAGVAFLKKANSLCIVGADGMAAKINSGTGVIVDKFKASKKPISSVFFSCNTKIIAVAAGKNRILDLEANKELAKFPNDSGPIKYISMTDDASIVVTSKAEENHLQVWNRDLTSNILSKGPVLSMQQHPSTIECRKGANEQDGHILAVSESGITYVWNLKYVSQKDSSTITVKTEIVKADAENNLSLKKSQKSIFAARLHAIEAAEQLTVLIAYGSATSPKFELVHISKPGKGIVIKEDAQHVQENGNPAAILDSKSDAVITSDKDKKANKKRAAPEPDTPTTRGVDDSDTSQAEDMDGVHMDDVPNEPTIGEKLANLKLLDVEKSNINGTENSALPRKPPSADSINVLLKQALHADDRALLLDCLYNQDEKVIVNSITQLSPSYVLKLVHSLVPILQSRGAVLACALPWIKCLILQHATGIMSHESSMVALNSVYQLIESRVSTFQSASEVSSCLDVLYSRVIDDGPDDSQTIPVIYEDKDSDEEEEEEEEETKAEEAMEIA